MYMYASLPDQMKPRLRINCHTQGPFLALLLMATDRQTVARRLLKALLRLTSKSQSSNVMKSRDLGCDGFSRLHFAAARGLPSQVRLLVHGGENPNAISQGSQFTPCLLAAARGHDDVVRQLILEHGADINAVSAEGMSVSHAAALNGQTKTVMLLAELGANLSLIVRGMSAFDLATTGGHKECAHYLQDIDNFQEMATASDTEGIRDCILSGSTVATPAQWLHLIPNINKRRELSTWACLCVVDEDACYEALFKPIKGAKGSLLREKIAHDGHESLRQLIASYVVWENANASKLFRAIMKVTILTREFEEEDMPSESSSSMGSELSFKAHDDGIDGDALSHSSINLLEERVQQLILYTIIPYFGLLEIANFEMTSRTLQEIINSRCSFNPYRAGIASAWPAAIAHTSRREEVDSVDWKMRFRVLCGHNSIPTSMITLDEISKSKPCGALLVTNAREFVKQNQYLCLTKCTCLHRIHFHISSHIWSF